MAVVIYAGAALTWWHAERSPGTGDAGLSLAQSLPLSGGLIVTLPQQVSLDDARRGLEMFRQLNVPILGVIENMSYLDLPDGTRMDVFGRAAGSAWRKKPACPLLGPSRGSGGSQRG
jgi:ATP-binding protein involved in chromosome partitioning